MGLRVYMGFEGIRVSIGPKGVRWALKAWDAELVRLWAGFGRLVLDFRSGV